MKPTALLHVSYSIALLTIGSSVAQADLLYYDGFTDAPGVGTPAGWVESDHDGVTLGLGISSGSLSYPNFAVSGNKWEMDDPRGEAVLVFSDTGLQAGETLFFSFLMQVGDVGGLTSSPSGIINLRPTEGAGHEVVGSIGFGHNSLTDAENEYRLSFHGQHRGFSHADSVIAPEVFTEGQTLLIVGSYARVSGGDNVHYWLNPDSSMLGHLMAPDADFTFTTSTGRDINKLRIGSTSSGALPGSYFFDEFRIGTTWADVTPVPEPSTYALLAGAGVVAFTIIRRRKKA